MKFDVFKDFVIVGRKPSLNIDTGRWAWALANVAVVTLLLSSSLPGQRIAPSSPLPVQIRSQSESNSNAKRGSGRTEVPVKVTLTSLLELGGIPTSVQQLQDLEKQAAKVAAAAVPCTVSVQIGRAQGCGVIITKSGYVLTAAHVATRPGRKAKITLSNGRQVDATTLGMNREVDAGLLKINPHENGGKPWPHATLGTSKDLIGGMWCVATGHPGGYQISRGPVTRVGRILEIREGSVVTDCALIGGDSGGPLFDIGGRLIAIHSRIGNDVDENLHVPIDVYGISWVRMQTGESWGFLEGFRPLLGLRGPSRDRQAIVNVVRPDSPAEEAGFKPGDIVTQFGDINITNFASLKRAVRNTMPGERVSVWVNRNGHATRLRVEIGRADD